MKKLIILFLCVVLFACCKSDDDIIYTNEILVLDQSCSVDGFHPDYCLIMMVDNRYSEPKKVYFTIHYRENGEWIEATTDTHIVPYGIKNIKLTINTPNENFCENAYAIMYVVQ